MVSRAAVKRPRKRAAGKGGRHVAVIGAGGNIGSHLVTHLARSPGVTQLTLVDPGLYEEPNLASQDIPRGAIGRHKVDVLEERLREIDDRLQVTAIPKAIEDTPLGAVDADVLLSCPDSRRARVAVSEISWRLSSPWVDAGVDGFASLARVTVRVPGRRSGCLECTFGPADYAALSQEYRCGAEAAPTRSPSWLGALAASLQVAECARLLSGEEQRPPAGWQTILDANAGAASVTLFGRNPACRFDHQTWAITVLTQRPLEIALADALALGPTQTSNPRLRVHGQSFARRLVCPSCGWETTTLRLTRRPDTPPRLCAGCASPLVTSAFHETDALETKAIAEAGLEHLSLDALGFLPGDVLTVEDAHFQLGRVENGKRSR